MTPLPSAIEIIVGILLLFGGGELFVGGSTALALLLGIPQIGRASCRERVLRLV